MSARADMVFTTAVMDLDGETQHALDEFAITKEDTGIETMRQYVEIEVVHFPKCKAAYEALNEEEKKQFWAKIDYLDSLMRVE